MRNSVDNSHILQDEILIIENSGEMPEVALHASLFYLTVEPEGPALSLGWEEMQRLHGAVVQGYKKIILRDLTLENRGKGLYRGLARCAVNWDRMSRFCQREGIGLGGVAAEVCAALQRFMEGEVDDVMNRGMRSCLNCSRDTLERFLEKIGFDATHLPRGWQRLL